MAKPLSLTLLYTAGIAGDLALLPRLYSFMQRLKPAERQGTLLLDLGGACADSVWHCRATGGRSTLIVLDGMGFHAANIEGALDSENRDKLAAQVTMALVDESRDWQYHLPPVRHPSIIATIRPLHSTARLQILLKPTANTRIEENVLLLQAVSAGQVGEVKVDLTGSPRILSATVHDLPPDTPPNPSIAGAVEFVESEARFYLQQRGQAPTPRPNKEGGGEP